MRSQRPRSVSDRSRAKEHSHTLRYRIFEFFKISTSPRDATGKAPALRIRFVEGAPTLEQVLLRCLSQVKDLQRQDFRLTRARFTLACASKCSP